MDKGLTFIIDRLRKLVFKISRDKIIWNFIINIIDKRKKLNICAFYIKTIGAITIKHDS